MIMRLPRQTMAGLLAITMAFAGTVGSGAVAQSPSTGPVTNLPMPRFVSMKAAEANIRRGPSMTHRVDWVFRHQGQPLIITAEYGHWRRVVDRDGVGGWVHYALLSGTRTVIVDGEMVNLHAQPSLTATVKARAEQGVIARLGDCEDDWCQIRAGGNRGWVQIGEIWGRDVDLGVPTAAAQ